MNAPAGSPAPFTTFGSAVVCQANRTAIGLVTVFTMRLIEESPWAECWKRTHPDCEATDESARVMAARAIAKYNDRYPGGYEKIARKIERALYKARYGDDSSEWTRLVTGIAYASVADFAASVATASAAKQPTKGNAA